MQKEADVTLNDCSYLQVKNISFATSRVTAL